MFLLNLQRKELYGLYRMRVLYAFFIQPVKIRFDRSIAPELVTVLVCKRDHVFNLAQRHVLQRYGRHPISRFLFFWL